MRHPRAATLCVLVLVLPVASIAPSARADPGDAPFRDGPDALAFSVEGVGAALLPGSLVHGTGLWVRGDRDGARALLRLEGLALSVAAVSGGILASTGASRRLANMTIPFLVGSGGLFLQTWLADIYGTAGGGRRGASASLDRALLSLEAGMLAVYDPQFEYGLFGRLAARSWLGPLRVEPELIASLEGDNQRARIDAALRVWGPGAARRSGDGSFLELATGGRAHRFGNERFEALSAELKLATRVDGQRIGASLGGSFAEASVGYGIEATHYTDNPGAADLSDMLLYRFASGIYIGRPHQRIRGELGVYYDHRRDELAGGVSPGQQASGFLGHFGLRADLDVGWRAGVVGSFEIGSAAVASLAFRYHLGSRSRP